MRTQYFRDITQLASIDPDTGAVSSWANIRPQRLVLGADIEFIGLEAASSIKLALQSGEGGVVQVLRAGEVVPVHSGEWMLYQVSSHLDSYGGPLSARLNLMTLREAIARKPSYERAIGERVKAFNNTNNVAVGGESVVVQWSDLRHDDGPFTIVGRMSGGAMDYTQSPPDFPAELILREYSDGGVQASRVLLFPGEGSCHFVLHVAVHHPSGYANPWQLVAHNPSGSNAVKSIEVIGKVIRGHVLPESWHYQSAVKRGQNDTNLLAGLCVTAPVVAQAQSMSIDLYNDSSAGDVHDTLYRYLPSVFGGPFNISAGGGTTLSPGSSRTSNVSLYGLQWFWLSVKHGAGPSGSSVLAAVRGR